MAKRINGKKIIRSLGRESVLGIVFFVLTFVLLYRLYTLQIVNGASYRETFSMQTTKTRTVSATRGNIYDRNGNILATSALSYSLTIEDNGTYETRREKNLSLNSEALRIYRLLEEHHCPISVPFYIAWNGNAYEFTTSGFLLERFRADAYGYPYIDDMTEEEANATATEMMDHLVSEDGFSIVRKERPYTEEELTAHGLPFTFTTDELLAIVKIRYALFTTSFQKYLPVTIATDLDERLMARLTENKDTLTGIEIVEDTKRVYTDPIYFSSIIGYTGPVSAEDLAELTQESTEYDSTSIVGKAGIERECETMLQGSRGQETVHVDNMGTVLAVDESSRRDPIAGNDVYLTIDKDLQIATYKILEQKIAGILANVIINVGEDDMSEAQKNALEIPCDRVYNALIENTIIDVHHFAEPDASEYEIMMLEAFREKQSEVFDVLGLHLTGGSPAKFKELTAEYQEYQTYIVDELLMNKTQILNNAVIDKMDTYYLAWTRDQSISMQEYLTYAASQNWINISQIVEDESYVDSGEIYKSLASYVESYLREDDDFSKLLYKYMIRQGDISGKAVMHVMYDQGVLDKEDGIYELFDNGTYSTYETLMENILSLKITPAMLALDPCTGSAVITDPNTGEVLACVTYPGYDNNRLANNMDTEYYQTLAADLSRPFYNNATQAKTAPGSTFKLVTTTAGLTEGVIDETTEFDCTGIFDLTETPLRCWFLSGHGSLDIRNAIMESCNVYFCSVAYEMGINEEGNWSDSLSLGKIQSYASMFDLDKPSGIEIPEAEPQVSDLSAIQSSIGQGTHAYTTTQMARYTSTLANRGTSYQLTILKKITDSNGAMIENYAPTVESKLMLSDNTWNVIHDGMRMMISNRKEFNEMPIDVAGKTGTAQESKTRAPHALFVGFAPYEHPEVAIAVRISNGYSSINTMTMARDILQIYFGTGDEEVLINGRATTDDFSNEQSD